MRDYYTVESVEYCNACTWMDGTTPRRWDNKKCQWCRSSGILNVRWRKLSDEEVAVRILAANGERAQMLLAHRVPTGWKSAARRFWSPFGGFKWEIG